MSSWPLRRKLVALVSIPMLVLMATGAFLGVQTAFNYASAHTARQLSSLAIATVEASIAVRAERAASITAADDGAPADAPQKLQAAQRSTDTAVADLRTAVGNAPRAGWSQGVQPAQQRALSSLDGDNLKSIRASAAKRTPGALDNAYTPMDDAVADLATAVTNALQSETRDNGTAEGAATLGALTGIATAAGQEQYRLSTALETGLTTDTVKEQLSELAAQQDVQIALAEQRAGDDQGQIATIDVLSSQMRLFRAAVLALPTPDSGIAATPAPATAAAFNAKASPRISNIDGLTRDVAAETERSAKGVETGEWIRAGLVVGLVLLTLISVATVLATIARSVTQPLRRLWTGAIDVASVQLPAAVQRIERDGVNADVSLPPVLPAGAAAGPETLEVARAVDDLGAEAVRLATSQVRLRRALDEAFVSMSRRSQSMVEKQLAIIDELERTEQDPDQLRNLFRLDHLAARMRRYNDNLLVLAGSAVRTRTTSPVKVAELFRAATSEMEHYERVRLQPVGGASIAGTVAGELIHLVAELLDNAAMYSPPTSPIVLSATVTVQGGLQLEIVDSGVGISPGELDRLNARLARPEGIDTQVPSRMGLFVVARLAQRGGFGVSLRPRPDSNGTVAEVLVPPALVLGTAGRTGEHPILTGGSSNGRPQSVTPPAGLPTRSTPPRGAPVPASFADSGSPSPAVAGPSGPSVLPISAPSGDRLPTRTRPAARGSRPAAAAASAAAPAPPAPARITETTSAKIAEAPDATPLPRRTRGGGAAPGTPTSPLTNGGELWPEAGGSDLVPLGGPDLFAPNVPAEGGTGETPVVTGPTPTAPAPRTPAPTGMPAAPTAPASLSNALRPMTPPTSPTGIPLSPLAGAAPVGATPPGTSPLSSWGSGARARQSPLPAGTTPSPAARSLAGDAGLPDAGAPGAFLDPSGPPPADDLLPRRERKSDGGRTNTAVPSNGTGAAPAAWDQSLPAELAARTAPSRSAGQNGSGANGHGPSNGTDGADASRSALIGSYDPRDDSLASSPIFDSISVWFDGEEPSGATSEEQVIDLRDDRPSSSRWSSLGDQRWLATNARASAAPETAGTTESGLPRRRPGANLLPSAVNAAPPAAAPSRPAPSRPAASRPAAARPQPAPVVVDRDADVVRGRLGSYQRGMATARLTRTQTVERPFEPAGASLFTAGTSDDPVSGTGNEHPGGNR